MIVFPNCKINLGLNIIARRADGYHDLETVFYPVQLCDALEIIPGGGANARKPLPDIAFSSTGLAIAGNEADNLCIKAWHILQADFPQLPPVQMHLHKHIPMGAGLGGGSSDGAFALRMLNDQHALGLTRQQLIEYAARLGSDCPFFILNQPCFAAGRGEILHPISLSLKGYHIVLVNPGIHVNTGWAFKQLKPARPLHPILETLQLPPAQWEGRLLNDFEAPVTAAYPVIGEVKAALYRQGAVFAAMSGSGSTLFGIFEEGRADDLDIGFFNGIHPGTSTFKVGLG